jgi:oligo-1,6-glucosidase
MDTDQKQTWWKEGVVYQIYPRSFYDSNGDGIGDLRGIIQKLDYLETLGVTVVWLCPVYKSPNDDNGYDISDYRDIMDEFGTLEDWEALLAGLHQRNMKLIMDLVVNHTSDEHRWFVESRRSKDNPYRDYYIWRPPRDGREPNNWASFFGGSAWQYDEVSGEYYLHIFSRKQPDLNWENPRVRAEVYDMMHWWLQKGIDGFRMDVINFISKVEELPDAPVSNNDPYQPGGKFYFFGPRLLEFLREMKQEVLSQYDIMTVGETPALNTEQATDLINENTGTLNMLFQFEHVATGYTPPTDPLKTWDFRAFRRSITRWQKALEGRGWNSLFLSNHDMPRNVSRFGDDKQYRVESAKLLATFNHLLQGTPYIYQGDEIGMTNVVFESIEEVRDISARNIYHDLVENQGQSPQAVLGWINVMSRDHARTPMQWDDSEQAGFTTGSPWIKVNPNYRTINVQQALADPNSIFYYYQKLIALRKENPVIIYGIYDLILEDHNQIYAFTRTLGDERLLVLLNFTPDKPIFTLPPHITVSRKELLIANYDVDPDAAINRVPLRPYEARVYRLW